MFSKAAQYSANLLFKVLPAIYRPLYFSFKKWQDAFLLQLMRERITPGMNILDIGANIGFYAEYLAALTGPKGKVYAFEPDPDNFLQLQKTCAALPQIKCFQAAVADKSGTLDLYRSLILNVDHRTYATSERQRKISVEAIVLDECKEIAKPVGFIKMDIQGFEASALRGMKQILHDSKPGIIMELWPYGLTQAGSSATEVFEMLQSFGYRTSLIMPSGKELEVADLNKINELTKSETVYYNILAEAKI